MKIFLIIFFVCAFSAEAQDFVFDKEKGRAIPRFICQLKLVKGQVFKKSGDRLEEVDNGERFSKNDTLVTGPSSFARLLVVDDTVISIGPSSELNFAEFDFIDKTDRKIVYNLIKGQLNGKVKHKAKEGDLKFKTRYTILGVRGTEILMNFKSHANHDVSEYALLTGKAEVTDEKNTSHMLQKGDRLVLIHNKISHESTGERMNLSPVQMSVLEANDIDEEKEIKPMLPYFELANLTGASSKSTPTTHDQLEDEKRTESSNWRDNLKKLNEKLKQNQN
jgi:hypothetical protein